MLRRTEKNDRTKVEALTSITVVEESGMPTSVHAATRREFRNRYGDEMADITEAHCNIAAEPEQAAAQDVKATLQAIIALPDGALTPRLDSLTHSLLMDPAWRRFRVPSLAGLTRGQLTECAQYALDHLPASRKAAIDGAEVMMTLALLEAAKDWHAPRRVQLVRAALALVFRAEYDRATAIIRKAHGELRARLG
jgi:hypothetical protein